jgi:hypothetical protein
MNPKAPLLLSSNASEKRGEATDSAKPCLRREKYLNPVSYIDDDLFSTLAVRLAVLFIILQIQV